MKMPLLPPFGRLPSFFFDIDVIFIFWVLFITPRLVLVFFFPCLSPPPFSLFFLFFKRRSRKEEEGVEGLPLRDPKYSMEKKQMMLVILFFVSLIKIFTPAMRNSHDGLEKKEKQKRIKYRENYIVIMAVSS